MLLVDNLLGIDKMICAVAQAQKCIQHDTCNSVTPADFDAPDFVVIDNCKNVISTTKAGIKNCSSTVKSYERVDALICFQGVKGGQAFSFASEEATAAVSVLGDDLTVSVFGAFTDTNLNRHV